MTGKELKASIRATGWSVVDLAARLGMSQQSLSAVFLTADVKTGLVERISRVTGVPVSALMGECPSVCVINKAEKIGNVGRGASVAQGDGAASSVGDAAALRYLVDELSALRRQNESLMEFITTYIKNARV